ncbi:MAG: hypothetical protein NTV86_10620 [Planctomycetota bacterium]|nr:hypothetical protein [Planctomycetota bacterium]
MSDKTNKASKTHTPGAAGKNATPVRPAPAPFEGVPDHASTAPMWKYVLLVGLFAAWVAFLVLVQVLGRR